MSIVERRHESSMLNPEVPFAVDGGVGVAVNV